MKNYQYVVIITHSRSGGTVLQRVLGSMPDTSFRGENEGAIVDICNLIFKIKNSQRESISFFNEDPRSEKSPFFGVDLINIDELITIFRNIYIKNILNADPSSEYIGWKECWFDPMHYGKRNIKKYFEVLKLLFPGIKIIFNLRDPYISSISPGLAGRPNVLKMIEEYHDCYKYIHNINLFENNSILIHHEDWKDSPEYLFNELKKIDLPVSIDNINKILSEELTHLRFLK